MKKGSMPEIEEHKRVHDMLLGPLERPALRWLLARMPAWVSPDKLTGLGVIGAVIVFIGYGLTHTDPRFVWLASLGFVVNWYGDSLDGELARFRGIERPKYGFFIDHSLDTLSMVLVFVGLGISTFVRLDIALLACIGYLLMSIFTYIKTLVSGEFQISIAKVGPTEMRAVAILANTLILAVGNPSLDLGLAALSLFDSIIFLIAVVEIITFVIVVRGEAIKLSRLDP
jgi:phosphatidylglycerophosphate synthase